MAGLDGPDSTGSAEFAAQTTISCQENNLLANKLMGFSVCRDEIQQRCRAAVLDARGLRRNPHEGIPKWTKEETVACYGQSLQAIGKIADLKTTKETNDSRKRTFDEYQRFLAQNPFDITLGTASPEDVAAFIHSDWIPNHSGSCRTILPQTGQPVASASAVRGVVKDISKSYRLLGYEGESNPARSELVKSYRDGLRQYVAPQRCES
jgi:hypothetical protein